MTPLDRYLKCVGSYLPRDKRDDIVTELRENLLARFEEAGIGVTEQAEFLKGYGSPLVIAARYRDDRRRIALGRELVGPILFPVFLRVLMINVGLTTIACIVLGIVFSSGLSGTVQAVLTHALIQALILVVIFALANRHFTRGGLGAGTCGGAIAD